MADLWGDPGPEVQWGFDSSTPIGGVADVVAEVISVSDGSVLAKLWPYGGKRSVLGRLLYPFGVPSHLRFGRTTDLQVADAGV